MEKAPNLQFLSLFVPDVARAAACYEAVFGVPPRPDAGAALDPHPFADGAPVVFDLGGVCLALYPCDGRTTHPGDVGIGVAVADAGTTAAAATDQGGQVFFGPRPTAPHGPEVAVFVLPDRHFLEVVSDGE